MDFSHPDEVLLSTEIDILCSRQEIAPSSSAIIAEAKSAGSCSNNIKCIYCKPLLWQFDCAWSRLFSFDQLQIWQLQWYDLLTAANWEALRKHMKTWKCESTKTRSIISANTWNFLGMPGVPGAYFRPMWLTLDPLRKCFLILPKGHFGRVFIYWAHWSKTPVMSWLWILNLALLGFI